MKTVKTARKEIWLKPAPLGEVVVVVDVVVVVEDVVFGLFSLLLLHLKKSIFRLPRLLILSPSHLKVNNCLQVRITATKENVCGTNRDFTILNILLLEASVSLVLAEMNIISFN